MRWHSRGVIISLGLTRSFARKPGGQRPDFAGVFAPRLDSIN